jgi:hypothetical protein
MDTVEQCVQEWGDDKFIDEINELGVPIILREKMDCFPNGRRFNFRKTFDKFSVIYFGATAAAAIANAIEEGFAEIVMHKMFLEGVSDEYMNCRAPVGFWVGQAIAHEVKVTVDPTSYLRQGVLDSLLKEAIDRQQKVRLGIPVPRVAGLLELTELCKDEVKRREARKEAKCVT